MFCGVTTEFGNHQTNASCEQSALDSLNYFHSYISIKGNTEAVTVHIYIIISIKNSRNLHLGNNPSNVLVTNACF